MQTIRVIHANDTEPLAKSLFKIAVLIIGASIIAASFLIGGANAYQSAMQESVPVYSAGLERFELFDGFWEFLGDVAYCLKVVFWCAVAIAASVVVLFVMISLGVLGWLFRLMFNGVGYVADLAKSQWNWARGGSVAKPQDVVIGTVDGKPLMLSDFCRSSVESDKELGKRVSELELRMSFVMPTNQGVN